MRTTATRSGTHPEHLVKDAVLRLLQEEARFRAAVQEGIAQPDRGEFIGEEDMDVRFDQTIQVLRIYPGAQDRP